MRRRLIALGSLFTALLAGLAAIAPPASAAPGGPVILMGIDAEDGGIGGHGPITTYESVVSDLLLNATKGAGILVLGGGKTPTDNVTTFWNKIGVDLGQAVTFRNGAAVGTQAFTAFELVVVVSDNANTPSGGLTAAENTLLGSRDVDFANHVNAGGGLLGFAQTGFSDPYAYLGAIGSFVVQNGGGTDITVTTDGAAVGLDNTTLDVCCWHDDYLSFPSFLNVLARYTNTSRVAAIGGRNVVVRLATTLTATPAVAAVTTTPGVTPYLFTVNATLRVESTGAAIGGATITFSATSLIGSYSCSATTGADGTASCALAVPDELAVVAGLGYTASFAGDASYLPSSGSGHLVTVDGIGLP